MFKTYFKYRKQAIGYFKNHPEYNATVHVVGGIGLGILIASPLTFPHPLRWAAIFMSVSLLGHLYILFAKK